eukprot:CAMPEP_0184872466 /NCGR_PEP_ID=MMETSP0580-20130426/41303_1 /TAXON_ID=1118495 /ORGANISM="Dactyliosolen fragilissimus" /LENGTH=1076 /DNA_ID=CAMNT_0027375267 /DNA_START=19 /DNA_END=3250 /DNA_ORIENTATION=-
MTSWDRPSIPSDASDELNEIAKDDDIDETEAVVSEASEEALDATDKVEEINDAVKSERNSEEVVTDNVLNKVDVNVESSLPDGWVELKDPDSGLPYYFNDSDNVTSWERPSISTDADDHTNNKLNEDAIYKTDDGVSEVPEEALEAMNEVVMKEDASCVPLIESDVNVESSLPDGWVELKDPDSDLPLIESDVNVESSLPDGWVELKDPDSDLPYYYNETENLTSWDRPSINTIKGQILPNSRHQKDKGSSYVVVESSYDCKNLTRPFIGETRCRPAHAIHCFGFGGRFGVMFPQVATPLAPGISSIDGDESKLNHRKGPVCIHRIKSLVPGDCLPFNSRLGSGGKFSLPLGVCSDTEVLSHLQHKAGHVDNDSELLWSLIFFAAKWKGRLRSAGGISDPNGPEAAILKLLLQETDDEIFKNFDKSIKFQQSELNVSSLEQVQNLLLHGKRDEAVFSALSSGQYALALLIARVCSESVYRVAAQRFAEESLPVGSPLYTVASLFANQIDGLTNVENDPSHFWRGSGKNLKGTWRHHLASIISNQTAGWKNIVLSLGDQLLKNDLMHAAHFCYMISGCKISPESNSSSRLVLIGCDLTNPFHLSLMTNKGLESFARTEAFEWAKRKGNPHAAISAFQPFKLRYAMLMADYGFEKEAKKYVDNIRKYSGIKQKALGEDSNTKKRKKATSMYSNTFIQAIDIFEDMLSVSSGMTDPLSAKEKNSLDIRRVLPSFMEKIVRKGSIENLSPGMTSDDEVVEIINKNEVLTEQFGGPAEINESLNSSGQILLDQRENKSDDILGNPQKDEAGYKKIVDAPKIDQEPNLMTPSDFSNENLVEKKENEEKKKDEKKTCKKGEENQEEKEGYKAQNNDGASYQSSQLSFSPNENMKTKTREDSEITTSSTESKEEDAIPSARSGTSIGSRIFNLFRPRTAHTGEKMEAYFDEKSKRWIFPGDDPAEVSKPLPPPPQSMKKNISNVSPSTTPSLPSDPLSSLMAPPTRGAPIKKSIAAMKMPPLSSSLSHDPPKIDKPRSASLHAVPSQVFKTRNTSPSPNKTPQFAIFQPVDKSENNLEGKSSDN